MSFAFFFRRWTAGVDGGQLVRLNEEAMLFAEPATTKDIAGMGLPIRLGQMGDAGSGEFFMIKFERLTQNDQRAG